MASLLSAGYTMMIRQLKAQVSELQRVLQFSEQDLAEEQKARATANSRLHRRVRPMRFCCVGAALRRWGCEAAGAGGAGDGLDAATGLDAEEADRNGGRVRRPAPDGRQQEPPDAAQGLPRARTAPV